MLHNLDPVFFHLGPLPIRWYPLAYIAGILAGFFYIKFISRKLKLNFSSQALDDLFCFSIIGIIISGRLGYILIYDPGHYLAYPLEILKSWRGGMAFHGGLIGFIVAAFLVAKKHKVNPWLVLDLSACIAPLGIFFGRIANFINGELFGRPTIMPWGVIFQNTGGGSVPRHPSQIYEALTEGLVLFIIMNSILFFTKARLRPGLLSGIFCIFYAIFRFIIENFRMPDQQIGYIFSYFTMGQLLSLVMLACGIFITLKQFRT